MPVLSETKKTQITDALVKCGIEPSEGAIAQIIELMKGDGRLSIPTAAKRLAETIGTNHNAQQTRTSERAAVGQSHQMAVVHQMGEMMGNQMTQMAGAIAVETFMNNVANGNFGAVFDAQLNEAFATMQTAWDTQYKQVIGGSTAPLLLGSAPVETIE